MPYRPPPRPTHFESFRQKRKNHIFFEKLQGRPFFIPENLLPKQNQLMEVEVDQNPSSKPYEGK
jgi:hypothetical protein